MIVLDRDRNVIYSEPNDDNRRATYYKMPEDGYIIVNNADGTIPDKYIRVLDDKPFYTIDDFNKGYWETMDVKEVLKKSFEKTTQVINSSMG